MLTDRELILACARLARSSPGSWEQFLGAFQHYAGQSAVNCVMSPLEELPRAQGRAQMAAHLSELFRDCLLSADKIERKPK